MNYPQKYIEFIKIIYQETYSQIQNNRYSRSALHWKEAWDKDVPSPFHFTALNMTYSLIA